MTNPDKADMPRRSSSRSEGGFTLLEIAVVMTIIGFIIGGIAIGKDLIRTSQLRSVATEVGRYTQAVTDFRSKYLALPGDFAGATALWGSPVAGCPSGANASTDLSTATCNGNGDGRITTQTADASANEFEQFRAWQHLANANMIDGIYSGIAGAGDPMQAIIGTNVPASQLTGAGYSLISLLSSEIGHSTGTHYYTGVNYLHILQFGAACGSAASYKSTLCPVLTPIEALNLDIKLDDGYPGTGKVMAPVYNSTYAPNCTTNATPALYATATTNKCSLLFLLGF